jgi:hypothetical protein
MERLDVVVDRVERNLERGRDLFLGGPAMEQLEHLALAG